MAARARRVRRDAVACAIGLSVLLGLALSSSLAATNGTIRVTVTGLRSDEGQVRWGLYNKKETFATKDGPIRKGASPIKSGQSEFVIPDVPYGTYAIIVGHDVNRDGKISENPFSAELKGMTNHSGKILSFPNFDKAKFPLDRPQLAVEIRVY